jgi:hypothetical protein
MQASAFHIAARHDRNQVSSRGFISEKTMETVRLGSFQEFVAPRFGKTTMAQITSHAARADAET